MADVVAAETSGEVLRRFIDLTHQICNSPSNDGRIGNYVDLVVVAAQTALELHEQATDVMHWLEQQFNHTNLIGRLRLFQLIDAICQKNCAEKGREFIGLVEQAMYRVVTVAVPKHIDATVNIAVVKKILSNWESSKLFPKTKLLNAKKYIDSYVPPSAPAPPVSQAPQPFIPPAPQTRVSAGPPNKKGRSKVDVAPRIRPEVKQTEARVEVAKETKPPLSAEEQAARAAIEEARTTQKRQKLEESLRPEGEDEKAEFVEMWHKVGNKLTGLSNVRTNGRGEETAFWEWWNQCPPEWSPVVCPPPSRTRPQRSVFVWDLDALIGERYYWSQKGGEALGQQMKELMFSLTDRHMFYEEIESFDQPHIDCLSRFDDGQDLRNYRFGDDGLSREREGTMSSAAAVKLSYRFRRIKHVYAQPLHTLFSPEEFSHLNTLLQDTNAQSGNWIETAHNAIRNAAYSNNYSNISNIYSNIHSSNSMSSNGQFGEGAINVVISQAHLVPTIAKCMLYGFSRDFPIENIYSACRKTKLWCIEQVMSRFGFNTPYYFIQYDEGSDASADERRDLMTYWERVTANTVVAAPVTFSVQKPADLVAIIDHLNRAQFST